ncbi:GHKL domain-containing protein, partial [Alistipes putredinis]|nr:GHKL domain-containing protein [Alistipes putredinis]
LDIIIRDKAEEAREKQIDFSAFIDFSGLDFIEPLDISTLFGNGIDNAIEASEKLPEDQRVILVKAGKVQDFVSILIENNCADEAHADGHTTKADKF